MRIDQLLQPDAGDSEDSVAAKAGSAASGVRCSSSGRVPGSEERRSAGALTEGRISNTNMRGIIGGGGYTLLALGGEMLLSVRVWVLAGAVVMLVLFLAGHDAGGLQAQALTPADICASSTVNIPATETGLRSDCEVLLGIKDTLRGTATLNWGAGTAFASWEGVSSSGTGASKRVSGINLIFKSLNGSIPSSLGDLTGLTNLNLWSNQLSGAIPSELGKLTSLTELILNVNQLSDEIPSNLGNLASLTKLDLTSNQLTGVVPSELGNLAALRELRLGANQLSGAIPSELGKLAALTTLYMGANQLSGSIPSTLGNLSSLTDVYLGVNQLTGSIPPELGGLTNLDRLNLKSNQLTGSIPSELGGLSKLRVLELQENELTGRIPSELGNLGTLAILYLWGNQLSGSIPPEIGNVGSSVTGGTRTDKLTLLALSANELTGEIPEELGNLGALTNLYLGVNQLSGSIPSSLGNLGSLTGLYLDVNQLTGSIPPELGSLASLRNLSLHTNQLTGSIPPELGGLTNLSQLSLGGNHLTGSIPPELGSLTSLQYLYLNDNQLTGGIPDLSSLTSLLELSLRNNDLTGSIPGLSALTSLTGLYLHGNQLTGSIPDLSALTSLTWLYLQGNQLTGSIPTWLGSLTSLTELYLHDNELTGDVPDLNSLALLIGLGLGGNDLDISWSTFESGGPTTKLDLDAGTRSMRYLYLHGSGLEGEIPFWIGAWHTDLTHLWLQDNGITGAIPSNFGNLTNLVDLRLHGNVLTGGWDGLFGLQALEVLTLTAAASVFTDSGRAFPIGADDIFLQLDLPSGADPSRSGVTLSAASVGVADVYVPRHPRGISGIVRVLTDSAVDITVDARDADGEPLTGTPGAPAVVCLPVPSADAGDDMRLLKSDDGEIWTYLDAADPPSGYDPGAGNVAVCGSTDGFSQFVPVVVEVGGSSIGGVAGLISRIEPSIRSVTISGGDVVRLGFDIYGRQDILDNDLGEGHEFAWDDGGAGGSFRSSDRSNEIIYTAPESPGTHTVTAASPDGACLYGEEYEERCNATFTITVRRSSAVLEDRPAPKNPVGEIPSVLADAEGRQYAVFTPEEGGRFDGGDVTISAEPGVVPNLEIVGVRADAAGTASNVGMTRHRYTLVGEWYDVLAVDASEASISSYVLNSPLEVCVPLPAAARHDILDIALVADNPDGSLTVLSASVRIVPSGVDVCGNLGTLPASIAVGTAGSPEAVPTAVADPDEIEDPDTGGRSLPTLLLLALMVLSGVAVATGVMGVVRR